MPSGGWRGIAGFYGAAAQVATWRGRENCGEKQSEVLKFEPMGKERSLARLESTGFSWTRQLTSRASGIILFEKRSLNRITQGGGLAGLIIYTRPMKTMWYFNVSKKYVCEMR